MADGGKKVKPTISEYVRAERPKVQLQPKMNEVVIENIAKKTQHIVSLKAYEKHYKKLESAYRLVSPKENYDKKKED